MLPLSQPQLCIGSVCLGGLIESDSDLTELKPFEITSVGQNYVYGKFQGSSAEVKLQNSQLCQISGEMPCKYGNENNESNIKNKTDLNSELDSIKVLNEINQKIMEEYYLLHNQYIVARNQVENCKEELLQLNSHYVEALKLISETKKQLQQSEKENLNMREENAALQKEVEHYKTINKLLKVTYEKRIKTLEDENKTLTDFQERKKDLLEVTGQENTIIKVRQCDAKTKPDIYCRLPQLLKNSSELDGKAIKKRAEKLHEVLTHLSGPDATKEDIMATLNEFSKQHPDLCTQGLGSSHKILSPGESVDLKLFLSLPMYSFRKLREFLEDKGISILAGETAMRKNLTERGKGKEVEFDLIELENGDKIAAVRVGDPEVHIQTTLSKISKDIAINDREIFIKLGGDKGGSSTKIAYEVVGVDPQAVNILSMFEAKDLIENIRQVLAPMKDSLNSLHGKKFVVNGQDVTAHVFLYGDYDWLCHILGHQGASASFPCVLCLCPLSDLQAKNGEVHTPFIKNQDGKLIPNKSTTYESRTIASYEKNALENRTMPNKNGKFHQSVISEFILKPADLQHVVPPSLHILLGLTLKFFNLLLDKVRNSDQNDENNHNRANLTELLEQREKIESEVEENVEKLGALEYAEGKLSGRAKRGKGACAATKCFTYDTSVVECCVCEGQFHAKCLGLTEAEYFTYNAQKNFQCLICQGVGSITQLKDFMKSEKECVKYQIEESRTLLKDVSEQIDALDVCLTDKVSDEKEKQLLEKLHELGIDRQAYHSNSFVGNHCVKILENSQALVDVLDDQSEKELMNSLFSRFYAIYKVMSANRFLNAGEVDDLAEKCYEFGEFFPRNFPNATLPVKFHLLTHHVPAFIKKWNSLGVFSEHLLESVHARGNRLHRTFSSTRQRPKQLQLVYSHLMLESEVPSTIKVKIPRKCHPCKVFLKSVNKKKVCPKCQVVYYSG